jgi:hypothetical protein
MTSEQRLDRLERIALMMARAGVRVRREQNEKINIIIDAQIKNEDRFARYEERFAQNEERFAQNEERFAKLAQSLTELANAQTRTENRLDSLIDIIKRDRNGNSG